MRWVSVMASLSLAGLASAQAPKVPDYPQGTTITKDIEYGPHGRNKLDLYVPKSDKPLPLVIWIHGGGWEGGDKGRHPGNMLAYKGYAIAAINYRYSKQAVFPAQIDDCKSAVRFLRDNAKKYNLNPDAFGAWGASAGGHLAALLGTTGDVPESGDTKSKTSSRVSAVCDWFGPTDLSKLAPDGGASSPITKLLGGTPTAKAKAKLAEQANPIAHISKGDAAFLTFHGDKDALVPLSQSEILHEALTKAGIESELVVLKGANHGDGEFLSQVSSEANRKKLVEFFDKHLKK